MAESGGKLKKTDKEVYIPWRDSKLTRLLQVRSTLGLSGLRPSLVPLLDSVSADFFSVCVLSDSSSVFCLVTTVAFASACLAWWKGTGVADKLVWKVSFVVRVLPLIPCSGRALWGQCTRLYRRARQQLWLEVVCPLHMEVLAYNLFWVRVTCLGT